MVDGKDNQDNSRIIFTKKGVSIEGDWTVGELIGIANIIAKMLKDIENEMLKTKISGVNANGISTKGKDGN